MSRLPTCVVLSLSLLAMGVGNAEEQISRFHSSITILADGSMEVVEEIDVRAEGRNIRRGIYRDFPTDYQDRLGNRYRVGFEVIGVSRDGIAEAYEVERRANGVRVRIGSASVFLPPDEYHYTLRYQTTRQLGYFDRHDELYWNVTGLGWVFPIEQASAIVELPEPVAPERIRIEGYTGAFRSRERAVATRINPDGTAVINTTRRLGPQEGLTLVLTWPKGLVTEPSRIERLGFLLSDNLGLMIALPGALLIVGFLFYAWLRVGRDPPPGVIFPHYEPPTGFSPASMRFVRELGYDKRALTAAVLNLAVKGYLKINQMGDYYSLLKQTGANAPLAPGERALLQQLFDEDDQLSLDRENHVLIGKAVLAHNRALKRNHEKIHFLNNSGVLLPAIAGLVLVTAGIAVFAHFSVTVVVVLITTAISLVVFYNLMKAPTRAGRKLMDQIDGFRTYLEVAEKDDLNLRNPPDKTPELFEQYLPYALALGVDQEWAESFAAVFARLGEEQEAAYQPHWYNGHWDSNRPANLISDLGSGLQSAISSAATPPGSSSGSGGGGFSGGGGGGGGGGGW